MDTGVSDGLISPRRICMTKTALMLALLLATAACSKVCEPKPLEGVWKEYAELIPPEGASCASTESGGKSTLQVGFEGKSGPHAFKILTEHVEAKGWKAKRYGGSSMDSLYEKDGKTLSFQVRDQKRPLVDLQMPGH
jgi:hypothetical protein